jgi:hypothetical protein
MPRDGVSVDNVSERNHLRLGERCNANARISPAGLDPTDHSPIL